MISHGFEPKKDDDNKEAIELSRKLKKMTLNNMNMNTVRYKKYEKATPNKPIQAQDNLKFVKRSVIKAPSETQVKQNSQITEQRSIDNESSFELSNNNYNVIDNSDEDDNHYDGDVSDYVKGEDAYYTDDYGCEDNDDSDTDYGESAHSDYPDSESSADGGS